MTYAAPTITSSGLTIPSYTDIRAQLIANAQSIFGSDIYLGTDSMDYQWISAVASIVYDSFLTSQMVYNARGITTAIGSNLDIMVKLNGLKRQAATYSTAYVTLTGNANATITNGIAGDANGYKWTLTTPVILSSSGTATALATCQTPGPITAPAGTITTILTPTLGWTSVTNAAAATAGSYAETDAVLKARQSVSTALPSRSIMDGIKSAIGAVSGVGRYVVYENDTNTTNVLGLPANSITPVVENGANSDIGNAIYLKKTPGCYTNGTTSVTVTGIDGNANTIRFYRPSYVDTDIVINVKQISGYTSTTTTNIQSAVANYISSLQIGATLYLSGIYGAALSANPIPANPTFSVTSVTQARHSGAQGTADLTAAFYEVFRGNTSYITVNVT